MPAPQNPFSSATDDEKKWRNELRDAIQLLARALCTEAEMAAATHIDFLPRPSSAAAQNNNPAPIAAASAAPPPRAPPPEIRTEIRTVPPALPAPVAARASVATPAPIPVVEPPKEQKTGPSLALFPTLLPPATSATTKPAARPQTTADVMRATHPDAARLRQITASSLDVFAKMQTIQNDVIGNCQRCKLCHERKKIVFGAGDPSSRLMFIGEGPGAEEDNTGIPFVGAAGQLLTKMIAAMGYKRDDVYICNIVKCRPPKNRVPEDDEVTACRAFVEAQIDAAKPDVIIALGGTAAKVLLDTRLGIMKLRGVWGQYQHIPVMPTYHPSFLLRCASDPDPNVEKLRKKEAWSDLQMVLRKLSELDETRA